VSNELPRVSIVVPTRPGQAEIQAVTASRALDYPPGQLEVIVARGRQPAVQRNAALKVAQGELIYFLDDDARPLPGNLRRAVGHFARQEVKMVGGPNVCPPDAPALEQVFAVVLGSWLAFGPSRARYEPVGAVRVTSEKELILCNLIARRDALLPLGGFDESLYPNEENALMDELQLAGGQLLYDPEFMVHRRLRPSLPSFFKMLVTYGRGRAEQFRLHPTPGSALNLVPPLFVVYLGLLLGWHLAGSAGLLPQRALLDAVRLALNVPVLGYCAVLLVQAGVSVGSKGLGRGLASVPLVVAAHLLYGVGFWRGLFTRLQAPAAAPPVEVQLEKLAAGEAAAG
jgi:succinoglycan biosynthesis protein ExoA